MLYCQPKSISMINSADSSSVQSFSNSEAEGLFVSMLIESQCASTTESATENNLTSALKDIEKSINCLESNLFASCNLDVNGFAKQDQIKEKDLFFSSYQEPDLSGEYKYDPLLNIADSEKRISFLPDINYLFQAIPIDQANYQNINLENAFSTYTYSGSSYEFTDVIDYSSSNIADMSFSLDFQLPGELLVKLNMREIGKTQLQISSHLIDSVECLKEDIKTLDSSLFKLGVSVDNISVDLLKDKPEGDQQKRRYRLNPDSRKKNLDLTV